MKAGTTSLHQYLSEHPEIFMSKDKELNFFNTSLNWSKGVDWYKEQFDEAYKVRGETSPNYTKWEGTAERVHSILPNIKLVYLLRDPVTRFVSQCNDSKEDPNILIDDLKKGKQTEIFTNGLYHKWYQEYLEFYSKSNILLITSEALRSQKKETLTTIFKFLNVDANAYNYDQLQTVNETHITSNKKIASGSVQILNKTKSFHAIKKIAAPIMPLLKPIWSKLFYKERVLRDLTAENKFFLRAQYQTDLQQLKLATGTTYYNSNA
jgi:hypothetical protein